MTFELFNEAFREARAMCRCWWVYYISHKRLHLVSSRPSRRAKSVFTLRLPWDIWRRVGQV